MGHGRTDYNRLRQRLLDRQTEGKDDPRVWKPEMGYRYKVRILPPIEGLSSFDLAYGMHYGLGEESSTRAVCPKRTVQKKCPVCEFVKPLWKGDAADKDLARAHYSKKRYLSNIVVLSRPDEVMIWEYGPQVWDQLAEITAGEEAGILPIDDPDKGYTLTVTVRKKVTEKGTFPNYDVRAEHQPSVLPDKSVLGKMHDIKAEVFGKLKTYDELRAILQGVEPEPTAQTAPEEPTKEVVEEEAEGPIQDEKVEDTQETVETEKKEAPADAPEKPKGKSLADRARKAIGK